MQKIDNKVKVRKECGSGAHTFIPTAWKVSTNSKVCAVLTCQHCLTTADKSEQEVMALRHNDAAAKPPAKAKAES